MSQERVNLGRRGEALVEERLRARGFQVIERNFRCRAGELDLITRQGAAWVFVEVRARRGLSHGTPEESITPRKRRHLIAAAQTYLQAHDIRDAAWRIDLAAVEFTPDGELVRLEFIENAIYE